MSLRTCVSNKGRFVVKVHRPEFEVDNYRQNRRVASLGLLPDGTAVLNEKNYPEGNVIEPSADIIYEIDNPFPFRGTTYINTRWAAQNAGKSERIAIPVPEELSLKKYLEQWGKANGIEKVDLESFYDQLPRPLIIALANSSTDPAELIRLAEISCSFCYDEKNIPVGLNFKEESQLGVRPVIKDHDLFEIIANNPHLPEEYKEAMVLRPGIQGASEIVGEWSTSDPQSHVFEYLRRNSYIPWGHFAANTANDTIRYRVMDLSVSDMTGMRSLYYQRTYLRLARQLDLPLPTGKGTLTENELEVLRLKVLDEIIHKKGKVLEFNGSLWGWNFGFGFAQSGYRLHASHQQIHQQYAMIPRAVSGQDGDEYPSFACGDMIAEFVKAYKEESGHHFFNNYLKAIRSNSRTGGNGEGEASLIVYEDENILLFVPKAQTSQWELQMLPLRPCGNILEADTTMRSSLDRGILAALKTLEALGGAMITSLEYSKRFDQDCSNQQLLYCFMPKLPNSPGAFSEAQLRWINGHYPEDFALACRRKMPSI